MKDTDFFRKAQHNLRLERIDVSIYIPDEFSQADLYKTYKRDPALKITCHVRYCYKEALDFHTYRRANTSHWCDDQTAQNVTKRAKHLQVKMNTSIFDPFDPSPSSFFLSFFKLPNGTNLIHEAAATWFPYFFMEKQADTALS